MTTSIQCVVQCASGRVVSFDDANVTDNTITTLQTGGTGLNQTENIDLGNALVGEVITAAFCTVTGQAAASITQSFLFAYIENPDGSLAVPIEGGGCYASCMPPLVRPVQVRVGHLIKFMTSVGNSAAVKANVIAHAASGKTSCFSVTAVDATKTELVDVQTGGSIGQSMAGEVITHLYSTFPNLYGLNESAGGLNFIYIENSQGQLKKAIFPANPKEYMKVKMEKLALRIDQNDSMNVLYET